MRSIDRDGSHMHLLFFANTANLHTMSWARGFAARGYRVTVVPNHEGDRRGPRKLAFWLRTQWRVRRLAAAPDAVLVTHSIPSGVRALTLLGIHPRVGIAWGSDVYLLRAAGLRGRLRAGLMAAFVRGCDAVIAPSRDLAAATCRIADLPIDIVPLGVDAERFSPAAATGPEGAPAAAARPDTVVFGFAKALRPLYGPDLLVEAMGILAADPDLPAVRLVLAGSGPLGPELSARAGELGVADRVDLPGRIDPAAMPDFLRGLDVYVMPSRSESFGVGALEAAAVGLPAIATAVGGAPEVVLDGQTGIVVPPEDPGALATAMARLARDRDLRLRLGRAGRVRVEREFTWQVAIDRFETVLRRVAPKPGPK